MNYKTEDVDFVYYEDHYEGIPVRFAKNKKTGEVFMNSEDILKGAAMANKN